MFALNVLIFFKIWGTFSLAEIRQDFHVPLGTCVCKAYVMEGGGLCQTFHLSHVKEIQSSKSRHEYGHTAFKSELALLTDSSEHGCSSLVQ